MFHPYTFEGPLEKYDFGKYFYHIVYLPSELVKQLPFDQHPKLRMVGEVNGMPYKGAWVPAHGRWYILLSKKTLKKLGVELGDVVTVEFDLDDQNAVDVPSELEDALLDNEDLKEAWEALTPGKRRGHAYRISSAKTAPTRFKRIEELTIELLG